MAKALEVLLRTFLLMSTAGELFNLAGNIASATPKLKSKQTCENHVMRLHCRYAHTLHVLSATYGRKLDSVCVKPNADITSCQPVKRLALLKKNCESKNMCEVPVNSTTMGLVCAEVYKYLNVIFKCVPLDSSSPFIDSTTHAPRSSTAAPGIKTPSKRVTTKSFTRSAKDPTTPGVLVEPNPAHNHGAKKVCWGYFSIVLCQVVVLLAFASV